MMGSVPCPAGLSSYAGTALASTECIPCDLRARHKQALLYLIVHGLGETPIPCQADANANCSVCTNKPAGSVYIGLCNAMCVWDYPCADTPMPGRVLQEWQPLRALPTVVHHASRRVGVLLTVPVHGGCWPARKLHHPLALHSHTALVWTPLGVRYREGSIYVFPFPIPASYYRTRPRRPVRALWASLSTLPRSTSSYKVFASRPLGGQTLTERAAWCALILQKLPSIRQCAVALQAARKGWKGVCMVLARAWVREDALRVPPTRSAPPS